MSLISNLGKNHDPVFTDEATRRKIQRHLSDINDKITDEDIENVKTDVTPNSNDYTADTEADRILKDETIKDRGDRRDDSNSNDVQSPWNIID